MKNQLFLSLSYHDLHQWTYENQWTDDTYQSWPIEGYDNGLIVERLMSQRHRKEQDINPWPPEPDYKDNVQPRDLTLIQYLRVPLDQNADP